MDAAQELSMEELAAIESAEREFAKTHEDRASSVSPGGLEDPEFGLIMPKSGEARAGSKENETSAGQGDVAAEKKFPACDAISIDAAAEMQGTRAYLVLQGAAVLGQFLSKFESLNVMCTFDFTEHALYVSLLDRGKACQVRVIVPKDACLAYAVTGEGPCSAIVSTKALKRCAAACDKGQVLTLSVSGNGEKLVWRLRPSGAGAGASAGKGSFGRDEQFTLRSKDPMDEDDGGAQSGNSICIDRAMVPPTLCVTLEGKEFGLCVDRAYKTQEDNMVVHMQGSLDHGFTFTTPAYSAAVRPGQCTFRLENADRAPSSAKRTLSVPFSLVYLQLLAAFRDGADTVSLSLPLRVARATAGKRKRDAEERGEGDDPARYPARRMPLQGVFFGKNAPPESPLCVRCEVILFRRDDPGEEDEENASDVSEGEGN